MKKKAIGLTIYNVAKVSSWVVVISSLLTGLSYLFQSPLDFASPIYLGIKLGIGMEAIRAWGISLVILSVACMIDMSFFKRNYWLIFLLGGVRLGLGLSSLFGAIAYSSQHIGYTGSISTITIGLWLMIIGAALIVGKPNGVEYTIPPLTPEEIDANYDPR